MERRGGEIRDGGGGKTTCSPISKDNFSLVDTGLLTGEHGRRCLAMGVCCHKFGLYGKILR